jgi:hypothetical protein
VADLPAHARHDPLRVAEAVDRGARLAPVLHLCARCTALYADLVALTVALPMAAYPARTRDFRLSAVAAHRLAARGWSGWWSRIGSARDSLTRPLAVGFTTLGLAGLLLTAAPFVGPSAGSAGSSEVTPMMGFGAAAGPSEQPSDVGSSPGAGDSSLPAQAKRVEPVVADPSSTLALSIGLLAAGGGLFAARRLAAGRGRMR